MKKVGRKPHGYFRDERAVHEIILLKRRARKGVVDREGNPKPTPYAVIARELNDQGHRTQAEKLWYGRLVCRILARIEKGKDQPKRRQKNQLESRDFLSDEEIAMCRAVYKGQEVMLFETLLRTGLRASELCSLQVRDLGIYRGKSQIDVREGKGCKSRTVFVGPEIGVMLRRHAVRGTDKENIEGYSWDQRIERNQKRPVFSNSEHKPITYSNLYYRIKSIARRSGVLHLHPHALRHTFARTLYNYKNNIQYVQEQLGHSSVSTTAIYAKTGDSKKLQEMEAVDNLFSPRAEPAVVQ